MKLGLPKLDLRSYTYYDLRSYFDLKSHIFTYLILSYPCSQNNNFATPPDKKISFVKTPPDNKKELLLKDLLTLLKDLLTIVKRPTDNWKKAR